MSVEELEERKSNFKFDCNQFLEKDKYDYTKYAKYKNIRGYSRDKNSLSDPKPARNSSLNNKINNISNNNINIGF